MAWIFHYPASFWDVQVQFLVHGGFRFPVDSKGFGDEVLSSVSLF